MLGIRSYKNYALDLWVGPKKDFSCDLMILFNQSEQDDLEEVLSFSSQTINDESSFKKNFELFYKNLKFEKKNLRHLAFVVEEKKSFLFSDPEKTFAWLKGLMDSDFFLETKRITLVAPSVEVHNSFQDELFQVF